MGLLSAKTFVYIVNIQFSDRICWVAVLRNSGPRNFLKAPYNKELCTDIVNNDILAKQRNGVNKKSQIIEERYRNELAISLRLVDSIKRTCEEDNQRQIAELKLQANQKLEKLYEARKNSLRFLKSQVKYLMGANNKLLENQTKAENLEKAYQELQKSKTAVMLKLETKTALLADLEAKLAVANEVKET